jgi:hypothetical protein
LVPQQIQINPARDNEAFARCWSSLIAPDRINAKQNTTRRSAMLKPCANTLLSVLLNQWMSEWVSESMSKVVG